jgi:hypothetical protein
MFHLMSRAGRFRVKEAWTAHAILGTMILFGGPSLRAASVIFYSGNLRTDATVTSCGPGCNLDPSSADADFAQWAAVLETFTVSQTTTMEAITYGYGGGVSLTGATVAPGGFEPYLSLFDASGNFLASTYYGTLCPPGANTAGGNCYDVSLDGGVLTPGTYQIAITAFENMPLAENGAGTNLSDGFAGVGNLAAGENLNYAFDVILPQDAPEPASLVLFAIACAALPLRKAKQSDPA